ncbi:MAG: hypothetical protein ACI4W0_00275 [Bacilli bacterium]
MNNQEIRNYAFCKNVKLWKIADKLGITDSSLSRKLRKELSEEEKQKIFKIIDELANE